MLSCAQLIDNLWSTGLEVVKQVVGADNVGPFSKA